VNRTGVAPSRWYPVGVVGAVAFLGVAAFEFIAGNWWSGGLAVFASLGCVRLVVRRAGGSRSFDPWRATARLVVRARVRDADARRGYLSGIDLPNDALKGVLGVIATAGFWWVAWLTLRDGRKARRDPPAGAKGAP